MKTKITIKGLITIAVITLQTNFASAQFNQAILSGNWCGRTNAIVTSIGIGNFTTSPSSALHVNTNILPVNTTFGAGEVFRTDNPLGLNTYWRMLRGGNHKIS